MPIPVALVAGALLASTAVSAVSAAKNRQSQENQNAIDRKRQDTAISRAVQQQRSVGINPVTSDGSTPQLQADSMQAPQYDASAISQNVGNLGSIFGSLYQSDMQREVNEQNQALSFLSTQQTNTQNDIQHLETLIEKADNDFKGTLEITDKDTQEFYNKVESSRKDYLETLLKKNWSAEEKALISALGRGEAKAVVKDKRLHIETDTKSLALDIDAGFSPVAGLKVGGSLHGAVSNQETSQNEHEVEGSALKVKENKNEDVKQIGVTSGDDTRKGFEKLSAIASYEKNLYSLENKSVQVSREDYMRYINLRADLVGRHEKSHSLLNRLRNDPNSFIKLYREFLNNM